MHDSFLNQSNEAITYLFEKINGLVLWDVRMLLNVMFKIIIANLLNDVVIMTALHDVKYFHYVIGF